MIDQLSTNWVVMNIAGFLYEELMAFEIYYERIFLPEGILMIALLRRIEPQSVKKSMFSSRPIFINY